MRGFQNPDPQGRQYRKPAEALELLAWVKERWPDLDVEEACAAARAVIAFADSLERDSEPVLKPGQRKKSATRSARMSVAMKARWARVKAERAAAEVEVAELAAAEPEPTPAPRTAAATLISPSPPVSAAPLADKFSIEGFRATPAPKIGDRLGSEKPAATRRPPWQEPEPVEVLETASPLKIGDLSLVQKSVNGFGKSKPKNSVPVDGRPPDWLRARQALRKLGHEIKQFGPDILLDGYHSTTEAIIALARREAPEAISQ